MSNKSMVGIAALAAVIVAGAVTACAPERSNRASPVVTQPIDEGQLVRLEGNTPPAAMRPENDIGALADDFSASHAQMLLRRSPQAEHDLEVFLESLHTPTSPNFHHWLTPAEYTARFGVADQDVAAVSGWLTSHGMVVNNFVGGTIIDFTASAAQIREAFHTEMHALSVGGARHISNMSDPLIPAALAPAITGVVSLNDFRPHSMVKPRISKNYTESTGDFFAVVPADLATIYNLNPLFAAGTTGKGQTVVVIEDTDVYSTENYATFRTVFGLDVYTDGNLTQLHPAPLTGDTNCQPPGVNADELEAILDTEWASASAPDASIVLAACADTNVQAGQFIALENLLNQSAMPPAVVSISYGECETINGAAVNAALKSIYQQAVAEGVSVFVSAGDSGAAGCDGGDAATFGIAASGWASTPYNVAVGGTDFSDTSAHTTSTYWATTNTATFGSALSYIPEIPWNDSCASGVLSAYERMVPYGSHGFCNSATAEQFFLEVVAGSGGPSGCATGAASTLGITSGTCRGYDKPSWQNVLGNPNDGVRDLPDVSLFAANGLWGHALVYCDSAPISLNPTCSDAHGNQVRCSCDAAPENWAAAGGTSFASPILAGIQALVVQQWGRQGNPNHVYYQLANAEYGASGSTACNSTSGKAIASTCIFNDVTEGDIDVNCTGNHSCYTPSGPNGVLSTASSGYAPAFAAHTGWDFATGLGTVNAANLVGSNAWSGTASQTVWTPPHR